MSTDANQTARIAELERALASVQRQLEAAEQLNRERAAFAEPEAQSILESMAEGSYGLDTDFRFTYVNSAGEEILGRRREEFIGKIIWDAFPEMYSTEIEATYRRALEDRRNTEFTAFFDPWKRWFNLKVYPSNRGLTIYFREITSQKQMELALLDSQERFEMINNFIPVMVFTTRPDGYHDYFNRRWTEYTGMSLEQTQGWDWSQLLHQEDRERTLTRWKHSLQTGEPYEIEHRFLRASDGMYRWFLGQAVPVRDRSGRIIRWFGTCTDIEDRKRVEAELAAARQSAEEASEAKSRFLASMSHELRTPLNAIIGYSEMLQEEVADIGATQLQPDLARIHTAGKHLLALISDILDLSKIEAGKMDVFPEEFDIKQVVDEVVSTVQPLLEKNSNRIEVQVQPGIGSMKSDVTKVRQALFNLLSNASKFTSGGQILVSAAAEGEHGRDTIIFRVKDTGIGIPEEKVNALFEPFAQVHGGSVKAGGTGLGLAITRRFCEMLGGSIDVDSVPGRGSEFTIRLPSRIESGAVESSLGEDESRRFRDSGSRGHGLILVVDDDADARDIMNRYLTREGYATVLAASGDEALRLAREVRPDVITLDVIMPGMDGWAVLQALKSDPELACIPVVMVTMIGDRSLGFALGASDFVMKPVTREKLSSLMVKFRCANPPCRVLIIEDDESARELVRSIFEREGWLVDTATNGAEGLSSVRERRPSLILLDLMMPVMNGFEFASQIRRESEFRDIPIAVLTARDLSPQDRVRLHGNVEKVLYKGKLSNEEVLSEVRELIRTCV